jgi:hypothetical protein
MGIPGLQLQWRGRPFSFENGIGHWALKIGHLSLGKAQEGGKKCQEGGVWLERSVGKGDMGGV